MTNNTNALAHKIAARLDAEYDVHPAVLDQVIDTLTTYARSKKLSAAKIPAMQIGTTIDAHTSPRRVHTSHADCTHEATKVARARCRRERAQIAA